MSVPDIDDRDLPAQLVAEVFAELNPLGGSSFYKSGSDAHKGTDYGIRANARCTA